MERKMEVEWLGDFKLYLVSEEKSQGTIEAYMRDVRQFQDWLGCRSVSKECVSQWKESLINDGRKPVTVNRKLAALNCFLLWMGWDECRVKTLKIQRRVFRDTTRELTKGEYEKLLCESIRQKRPRLTLLMETICSTGIRVGEVKYITVESLSLHRAEVHLKGKIRVILLPGKLCRKLMKYCKEHGISEGEVFRGRNGESLSRKRIWKEMKDLCESAGVEPSKVFPHNLRHLFARCFYRVSRDLVRLADVLGHSNVETTRVYLISTGEEHERVLDRLRLIS